MPICYNCRSWIAPTLKMHKRRLRNMTEHPNIKPHRCPVCGGTEWATAEPAVAEANSVIYTLLIMASVALLIVLVVEHVR